MAGKKQPEWRNRVVGFTTKPASQFTANSLNFRRHPNAQREAFRGIVSEIGFAGAVLENVRTGNLIDGHLRIEEALSVDDETPIPCVQVDLSDAEEKLLLASYDPISAMAVADKETLDLLLRDVSTGDAAVSEMLSKLAEDNGLYFGEERKEEDESAVAEMVDRAAELQEKFQVQRGQIWQIGRHRLMCGDSTKTEVVSEFLGGERACLMVTDPPYGVSYHANKKGKKAAAIMGDLTQAAIPLSFAVAVETALDDDARLYLFGGTANWPMYSSLFDHYLRMQPRPMIWVKETFVLHPTHYHSQYETVFFGWKGSGGGADFWFGERTVSDVWDVRRDGQSERLHPTQKPVEVCGIPIRNSSPRVGIVYEPFCGSGSTLIACEQEGRQCRAIELDPKFVAVALERMSALGLTPELIDG